MEARELVETLRALAQEYSDAEYARRHVPRMVPTHAARIERLKAKLDRLQGRGERPAGGERRPD